VKVKKWINSLQLADNKSGPEGDCYESNKQSREIASESLARYTTKVEEVKKTNNSE